MLWTVYTGPVWTEEINVPLGHKTLQTGLPIHIKIKIGYESMHF
jgi:hypothetical protein